MVIGRATYIVYYLSPNPNKILSTHDSRMQRIKINSTCTQSAQRKWHFVSLLVFFFFLRRPNLIVVYDNHSFFGFPRLVLVWRGGRRFCDLLENRLRNGHPLGDHRERWPCRCRLRGRRRFTAQLGQLGFVLFLLLAQERTLGGQGFRGGGQLLDRVGRFEEDVLEEFVALFRLVLFLFAAQDREAEEEEFLVKVGLGGLEGDDGGRLVQVDDAVGGDDLEIGKDFFSERF